MGNHNSAVNFFENNFDKKSNNLSEKSSDFINMQREKIRTIFEGKDSI